MNCYWSRR